MSHDVDYVYKIPSISLLDIQERPFGQGLLLC